MSISYTKDLPINGLRWREQVKSKLLDGYGSEDIAIWLDCHPQHVRDEIGRLRKNGDLNTWFKR
jgi:hypothetical protein